MWWSWIFIVRLKGYEGWSKDLFPGKIETSLSPSYRCTRVWWEMWESISLLGVTQYYTYPLTNIHTLIYIFKCWSFGKLVYINGFKCLLGFSHTLSTIWNWLQPKVDKFGIKYSDSQKSFWRGLAWSFVKLLMNPVPGWLFTIWLKAFWACIIQFQKVCQCLNINSGAMFLGSAETVSKSSLGSATAGCQKQFRNVVFEESRERKNKKYHDLVRYSDQVCSLALFSSISANYSTFLTVGSVQHSSVFSNLVGWKVSFANPKSIQVVDVHKLRERADKDTLPNEEITDDL